MNIGETSQAECIHELENGKAIEQKSQRLRIRGHIRRRNRRNTRTLKLEPAEDEL